MFKWFWKKKRNGETANEFNQYIEIPKSEINEDLKQRIMELERISEEFCNKYQEMYKEAFKKNGKENLRLWITRDIDGDCLESITSNECLDYEYRSEIGFDYDGPKTWEVCTIHLWYYYQGYFKNSGVGTFYNGTIEQLEKEIIETLEHLLNE
ncbi:hypothetical protein CN326_23405 [Bacillus sp. AFS018417]|uniref:hypothetical protein n=1 Tax=Bacillus TaxID=1386 RepID=UPI000BF62B32|nr:hypothetical protein [Bacillus sp. AFS018417]PEY99191.1 hypothetical protein CN326_23405 [Bacillus sp. AFS018417]